jgi:autophagy-related protein 11
MAGLQILVIPLGQAIVISKSIPNDLANLATYLADATGISPENQLLLNPKGKQIRLENYLSDNTIYLYDRVLFSASGTALNNVHLEPLPRSYDPEPFPNTLADSKSLKAWQDLFNERRAWSNVVLQKCQDLRSIAEEYITQRSILEAGVKVATSSVEAPLKGIEKRLGAILEGMKETTGDTEQKISTLEADLARLQYIPALGAFAKFFLGDSIKGRRKSLDVTTTLDSFVDGNSARTAVSETRSMFANFTRQTRDFDVSLRNLGAQTEELKRGLDVAQSRSLTDDGQEPTKLINEIEAVTSKISADCDTIMGLRNEAKSVAQASRVALLHTKDLLPGLQDYAKEMSELLHHAVEQRNSAVVRTADLLQMVASIEAQQTSLTENVLALKMSDADWLVVDRISLPSEIPSIYGSLLAEAVRRNEWVAKMRRDSSNLAEEIAGYKEEEQKRRKKWNKAMNGIIPRDFDESTLGVEINLQGGGEESWPEVTRTELDEYVKALQDIQGTEGTLTYLKEIINDIERPTRQQVKRAKGFKNGSVHEASFGKNTLLLRGEDERVMKEAMSKLEEDLRSSKSRIRKLEDLLHRKGTMSAISAIGQNGLETGNSDFPDRPQSVNYYRAAVDSTRRPSSSSRRFSSANDEKVLARRMVQLEAEIVEERRLRTNLEKEVSEANSTKTDIMDNMEARQIEFAEERKSLEDELAKLKQKIEELEDELDRVVGSRDEEKTTSNKKFVQITGDLEKARKDHASEIRSFEQKLQEQGREHQAELNRREQAEADSKDYLTGLLMSLAPDSNIPSDLHALMSHLDEVAQKTSDTASRIQREIALAKSENDSLRSALGSQRAEVASLAMKLDSRESDISKAKEDLALERAKASSISKQLNEEKSHLKELRDKFADGETGSEALRRQLIEEENKVSEMSSKLAEVQSHNNSLDVELFSVLSKYRKSKDQSQSLQYRLDQGSQRAKEISRRLYTQNNRLLRLLEALGFAIGYDDGNMTVQRASKVTSASMSLIDQSIPGLSQSKRSFEDLSNLGCLLWMEEEASAESATKYEEYVDKLNRLQLEVFCDAITKRMRDIEHTARKYQRESRAYRDRNRKNQTESHDKIAYRNFKEGDLALFLPTRKETAVRSWAAFNIGAPHYFLREHESHRLAHKEWLVARITKMEERVVDLSKTMASSTRALDGRSVNETASEGGASVDDDNPFDLSDGLRWYYLEAAEEKPGAPTTPGLGKTTVAAANVDVRGSIRVSNAKRPGDDDASKHLSKSLDSRRSSTASKKSGQIAAALGIVGKQTSTEGLREDPSSLHPHLASPGRGTAAAHLRTPSATSSLRNAMLPGDGEASTGRSPAEEVRKDELLGP